MNIAVAAFLALLGLFAATATASMIPIYANTLEGATARAQVYKSSGDNCKRAGSGKALRVTLGAETRACSYAPAVNGRDLDVAITGRLLSGTPTKLQRRVHLGAALRTGEGGSLEALVYPVQRKVQVVKNRPDGTRKFLAIVKDLSSIRGVNRANRIYLRAVNQGEPGNCRITVRVNGKRAAFLDDPQCAELKGRGVSFGVGATRGGEGATASFAKLQVALPSPF